jgi:hypothetical protein
MSTGPEGERNQLCVQIKASTVVADSDVRNESIILPPVLNVDSEATVETGTARMSFANLDNIGYLLELHLHHNSKSKSSVIFSQFSVRYLDNSELLSLL